MSEGLLSLKWNDHRSIFFESLSACFKKEVFTDATLACEGKFFPVHKFILSTCSDYFNEIFKRTPCKRPFIILKDIQQKELQSLLDYMYLGEVEVSQTDLGKLIQAAECLQIKGLAVADEPHPDNKKRSQETYPYESSRIKRRRENVSKTDDSVSQVTLNTESYSAIQSQKEELTSVETIKIEQDICGEDFITPTENSEEKIDNFVDKDSDDFSQSENFEVGELQETLSVNTNTEIYESPLSYNLHDSKEGHSEFTIDHNPTINHTADSSKTTKETIEFLSDSGHLKITREKYKSYECQHCPFKTSRSLDAVRHVRTHTGEKPFHCPYSHCPFRTGRKASLQYHILSVHNTNRVSRMTW